MLNRFGYAFVLTALLVSSASADDGASALLSRVEQKARQTGSLSAKIVLTRRGLRGEVLTTSGSAVLLKPNFALVKLSGGDTDIPRQVDSDGQSLYTLTKSGTYTQVAIDSIGAGVREPWWNIPLRFFFVQSLNPFSGQADPTATYKLLPDERFHGSTVHVLSVEGKQVMSYSARYYIDAADRIVASQVNFGNGPSAAFFRAELTDLRTGGAATPAAFRFHVPAGSKLEEGKLVDLMLPLGEMAPQFNLTNLEGQQVTLSSQWKGAKATLLNFWFVNCPPCRIEFPDFEKLYVQLHAKGFNIVAVDKSDSSAAVSKYIHSAGLTFPVLLGGEPDAKSVFAQYRVTDIFPASYLLDAQGHIVYRATGGDIDGLRKALAGLGLE